MEDKNIGLTDVLIKTAAFEHNANINKAGFSPLQLVTGKAASIPGLTMGNEGSESLTDADAVNRIMETRKKLKDYQGIRVRNYQHQGNILPEIKYGFNTK